MGKTFLIAGHVDAGKSTLAGKILLATGLATPHDVENARRESTPGREYSRLAATDDPTGKTLELAQFDLGETVTMIDTPGHKLLFSTLIEASQLADVAVYVVSTKSNEVEKGLEVATEHLTMFRAVGINHLIVVLSKIDTTTADAVDEVQSRLTTMLKKMRFEFQFLRYSILQTETFPELMSAIDAVPGKVIEPGEEKQLVDLVGQTDVLLVCGKKLIFSTSRGTVEGIMTKPRFLRPGIGKSTWRFRRPMRVAPKEKIMGRDESGNLVFFGVQN